MANVLNYIKKYGNKSFIEEPFNDIDNAILSTIVYSNFEGIISNRRKKLKFDYVCKKFLKKYTYKDIVKIGSMAIKDSYKIIEAIYKTKRYGEMLVHSYRYISSKDVQFGAMTFVLPNGLNYIAFEGTDQLISGWKEDFELMYMFPVPAQEYAIKYINEIIRIFDHKYIVGGHSKGGNLALVSSMYCNLMAQSKIIKIYSNDGPGLRIKELKSRAYEKVEKKYSLIIPDYSVVGLLLRHNHNYKVIKSSRKDLFAHSVLTWQVTNKEFLEADLSTFSKKLDKSINLWLDDHDDLERKKAVKTIFGILEELGLTDLNDMKNIKNAIAIIKKLNGIDKETKDIVMDFLTFNLKYVLSRNNEK